jgi:hypothetical protein
MLARLPGAEAVTVPGVGHAPLLTEPEADRRDRPAAGQVSPDPATDAHSPSSFQLPAGRQGAARRRLINAFGPKVRHTIVSAVARCAGRGFGDRCAHRGRSYPTDFEPLAGKPHPARLLRLARAMKPFDLVLTYNWGAMDAVSWRTFAVSAITCRCPPLVHHEDGFNQDEASGSRHRATGFGALRWREARRWWCLRVGWRTIALRVWHQPRGRVHLIENGIDTAAYARARSPTRCRAWSSGRANGGLARLPGCARSRTCRAWCAPSRTCPRTWQLVILGEGPEREAIRAEAMRLGVAHRVHLPGFVADPAKAVGLFDMFALSSDSEQFPISVVEAMAAGLPVVSPAVGDVAGMVAEENGPFVTRPGDEGALSQAIETLVLDDALRARIGEANRRKAAASYDEANMIAAYRRLYASASDAGRSPEAHSAALQADLAKGQSRSTQRACLNHAKALPWPCHHQAPQIQKNAAARRLRPSRTPSCARSTTPCGRTS